jgi:glucosamine-6-phosphate deaminase
MDSPHTSTIVGSLRVCVFSTRLAAGACAAADASAAIRAALANKPRARVVFASAPSQREVLAGLAADASIEWSRVDAFHMDEYIGLPASAPQCFAQFLRDALWERVRPAAVHVLDGNAADADAECARYAALLAAAPVDVVILGVGENGHIAFNDPGCDLADAARVRRVALPESCRAQQVNDGCFRTLADVPTAALTLTVPALLAGARLFCVVPGPTKTAALRATLTGPVSNACPASALRAHADATLYADDAACGADTLAALAQPAA